MTGEQRAKRSRLRAWGEAVGVIAVVVSMGLVAMEINQANKIAISSVQLELMAMHNSFHSAVIQDPELAAFVAVLKQPGDQERDPVSSVRVQAFVIKNLNTWSAAQIAYDNGHMGETAYEAYREAVRAHAVSYPQLVPAYWAAFDQHPSLAKFRILAPLLRPPADASVPASD